MTDLHVVMVRFGSVRFRGYFARTPNRTIGSSSGIFPNPELNPRFGFKTVRFRFREGPNAEPNTEPFS
jgi:hypothetical protein